MFGGMGKCVWQEGSVFGGDGEVCLAGGEYFVGRDVCLVMHYVEKGKCFY